MYQVRIDKRLARNLKKQDKYTLKILKKWINDNLVNCENPRQKGKELKEKLKGIWRYRIGNYRLFAIIKDKELIIILIDFDHRKNIYKQ